MLTRIPRAIAIAGCACAAILSNAPSASAISISVDSITKLAGNTATGVVGSSNRHSSYDSQVSILNPGTSNADLVGNTVVAQTRYASTQTSDDNGVLAGGADLTATASYEVKFTVTPSVPGETYDLKIDTSRIGAFVLRNEGSGGASNRLTAVTGTFTGPSQSLNSLPALPGLDSNSTVVQDINQSNTSSIVGLSGAVQYTLSFTWQGVTHSANGAVNADESVILMGLDTRISSDVGAADDYPGTSGRTNPAGDGHFVTITATVATVPEPSTFAIAGIGGIGLGLLAIRRRK